MIPLGVNFLNRVVDTCTIAWGGVDETLGGRL